MTCVAHITLIVFSEWEIKTYPSVRPSVYKYRVSNHLQDFSRLLTLKMLDLFFFGPYSSVMTQYLHKGARFYFSLQQL